MHLELSDEETAALIRELHDIVESDRFPLSPRIRTLQGILDKLEPPPAREPPAADEALRTAAIHPRAATARVKSSPGPRATLGSTAEAHLRLIVWCRDWRHQVEPDPAEMAERYPAVAGWAPAPRYSYARCTVAEATQAGDALGVEVPSPYPRR
jgi:hypothetical protein